MSLNNPTLPVVDEDFSNVVCPTTGEGERRTLQTPSRVQEDQSFSVNLLAVQDVVFQVLHQLGSIVLVEQEVLLFLRQRCHDTV